MSWPAVEAALDGILARRWYTNHGPMAQALEAAVAATTGVRHAVAVTNPTIALVMLLEALSIEGPVHLSALAPLRCVQAIRWAGLHTVFHDFGAVPDGSGAVLVASDVEATDWADLAWDRGLPVLGDGVVLPGVPAVLRLPGCGDDAGAACVLTEDDALGARLRNIRSSYGAGPPVPVRRTANGRLSEAQAAMSLLAWPPSRRLTAGADGKAIVFGDGVGVLADTVAERDRLLATVPNAVPMVVSAPPGTCPAAERMAARVVILPHGAAG